ncbi:MAG: Inosose dehydratase [Verrucomicrobiota bacterium]|jgi:sugar phosphate isomerase/epimerase
MKRILLSLLTLASTVLAGDFAGETGLQLYSLRDIFKTDPAAALDKVKSFGVKVVETYNTPTPAAADLRKMLDERGIKAVSGHFGYDSFTKEPAVIVASAKALGLEYVGCAWIPHTVAEFSMEDAEKAAADFNKWGEALAKDGLKFMYHCHGYEFKPIAEGSEKTFMDVLMEKTKPEFVAFEMDVFWVVHPGADPVKYLNKYPKRWQLLHIKDMAKTARVGIFTGKAPHEEGVVVGTGRMDWSAILKAAAAAGVKHYFIEDEHPAAATQIPQSIKYLETLK